MIGFLDIEASSLSAASHPIEISVVFETGTGETYLIRSEPTWTDWPYDSAQVHGITREDLVADGSSAADVARRLSAALAGHDMASDAPEQDTKWLTKLMQPAALPTPPIWNATDVFITATRPLFGRLPSSVAHSLARSILMQAETEMERADGIRHRAGPDARRLWLTWQRVGILVSDALEGWPT